MNNRLLFLTFILLIFFLSLGEGNKEVETTLKPQNTLLTKNEDQILLRDARETRRKKREKRKRKARKSKLKKKGKNKKNKKRRSKVRKSKQKLKKSTNKKTRKNKSMRKKEKRRTRRLKKTQRKKGQKARKARKCGRQNTIDETCLTNLVNSISFERDQVTNFLAQYNRIKNFAKLVGNKAAKKGDFSNSSSTLLEALGGNGSNPACAGQRMTRGSRNAAVDSYKKLSNCSSTIETSCLIPNGTYLPDALDTCNATYQEIKTKNKQCTTKTTNQDNACACWAEAFTLVNKAKNSTCDAKKPSDSVRKLKVACINTFSGCKKAEDASIGYIVTCRTCNSSAGECDLTTAGAGGAATTGPPPLSATAPAATTSAAGGGGSGEQGSGGPLDGPTGPTVPGSKCSVKVTFPKKTSPVSKYPLFTTVFGIPLMGSGISDTKFQHIASQMALWIDNDQDGCPDTPEVVTWLVKEKVLQWFGPGSDTPTNRPDGDAIEKAGYKVGSALLFDQEISPSCSGTAGTSECSDASIEEIWHVVTADGYAKAFPKVFSSSASSNSSLTKAMDVARGGRFTSVPSTYPSSAWYTYYDKTCEYDCQAVEYIYWAVASYVGALDKRTDVISEWKYNTKDKLIAGDKLVTALIQDTTKYRLPTSAPNGDYRGCSTCSTGVNHGGN